MERQRNAVKWSELFGELFLIQGGDYGEIQKKAGHC